MRRIECNDLSMPGNHFTISLFAFPRGRPVFWTGDANKEHRMKPGPTLTLIVLAAGLTFTAAAAVLAHTGVQDPTVKARMALMGQIQEATATLGDMVRGKRAFSPKQARAARAVLITHADRIPAAFEKPASDPKSESRAEIWQDWTGFTARAAKMEAGARALDTGTAEALSESFAALASSCSGCHKHYRIKK
jgi:cytochrome c556